MTSPSSSSIPPPAVFFLRAAQGWLELGNAEESYAELRQVPSDWRHHPEVLELEWHILARQQRWEASLPVAEQLALAAPQVPAGWVHRSFALHELQRTEEALENLLAAHHRFPKDPLICYNLACYECQLGRELEALEWLRQAFALGGRKQYRAMARRDPDLKPLWKRLP